MSSPILNRDFQHPSDGWYQIEAKGEHPNRAAGVVQVVDNEAAQSIVNHFNAAAAAGELRHGSEMLIDHEHFSDQPDQETRAYGWLEQLQNRADGIYGRIRWTATGKPAVDGGDYRFFSTEYEPRDLKVLNGGNLQRVRPLRLAGLSLTNMFNNRGQKPITNADRAASDDKPHQSEIEAGFPVQALEAWFQAVSAMFERLNAINPNAHVSWQSAWNMCQKQHPEMYAAAFETEDDSSADDSADPKAEADAAAKLVNRVMAESKMNFSDSWNFTQRAAPRVFNRAARSPARLANRQPLALPSQEQRRADEDRQRAGIYFQRLVNEEKAKCGGNYQTAFNKVRNRETSLTAILDGRRTGAEIWPFNPQLFRAVYDL